MPLYNIGKRWQKSAMGGLRWLSIYRKTANFNPKTKLSTSQRTNQKSISTRKKYFKCTWFFFIHYLKTTYTTCNYDMCSATMIITFSNFHCWVGSTLRLVSLLLEPTLWTNQKVKPRFDQRRPVSPSHRFTLTLDAEKNNGDLPKRWRQWFRMGEFGSDLFRIHEAVMKHSFIWASCIWRNTLLGLNSLHSLPHPLQGCTIWDTLHPSISIFAGASW